MLPLVEKQLNLLESYIDTADKDAVDYTFSDFLYDWYANFTWIPNEAKQEYMAVINHPRFKSINERIRHQWERDLHADLLEGIAEVDNEIL